MARRDLRDSRILITGASSGIGRALALALAREGARLVLVARREDKLRALATELAAAGPTPEIVIGDVTDALVRSSAIERAVTSFGGLDVLVNNAGIGALGRFDEADPQRLRQVFDVNFFALVEMTRAALPRLAEGKCPLIVNISSVLGHVGIPLSSEYCASKFAVQGFSQSLRAELAGRGIDVLVVCPGTTETEFFTSVIERRGPVPWSDRRGVPAEYVARRTVQAMRAGSREIVPNFQGWWLVLLSRIWPGLLDFILRHLVPKS
jgi:short-subunit dehydrogenase